MIRYFLLSFMLLCVAVVAIAGFRGQHGPKPPIEIFPDMDHQPRINPQHPSGLFADGRGARKPVTGTVPLGYVMPKTYYATGADNNALAKQSGAFSSAPDYYNTGMMGTVYGDGMPLEVTPALVERGRARFTINCAICHGATGAGNGIVGQFGLNAIANLLETRIRTMPDGQIFNTITNGKNTMGAYGPQVTVEDRWAIISYLRALQRSQAGRMEDVPADQRAALKPQPTANP
jgi:mono/diheme cytochrome c family protein